MEFALNNISFPVGRLQILNMFPLTFNKFLISMGKELLAEKINQPGSQFSESVINMINNEMYNYFIIGGMPECVDAFINTGSFIDVISIQSD